MIIIIKITETGIGSERAATKVSSRVMSPSAFPTCPVIPLVWGSTLARDPVPRRTQELDRDPLTHSVTQPLFMNESKLHGI